MRYYGALPMMIDCSLPCCQIKSPLSGEAEVSAAWLALPNGSSDDLDSLEHLILERTTFQLAKLPRILQRLAADLPEPIIAQTVGLSEMLLKLTGEERPSILGSPHFCHWFDKFLQRDRLLGESEILVWINRLPILLLPVIGRRPGTWKNSSFDACLVGDGRCPPIGLQWGLRHPVDGAEQDVRVYVTSSGVEIHVKDNQSLRIPMAALRANALIDQEVVGSRNDVCLYPRRFCGSTAEFGHIDDYAVFANDMSIPPRPAEISTARRAVDAGVAALNAVWPEACQEVTHLCRLLVPVDRWSTRVNATHGSLLFAQMLTVNIGEPLDHAEDLLHEAMHTKLWCLSELTPLLENDGPCLYRHPWRSDLRPLRGVLAGTHAFLAVLELYRRALASGFSDQARTRQRYSQLREEVAMALRVLETEAIPTQNGQALIAALRQGYQKAA